MFSEKKVLILEWTKLPQDIKNSIADDWRFRNDVMFTFYSETGALTPDAYRQWYVEDTGEEDINETAFNAWIKDQGYLEEYWLVSNYKGNLADFDEILIDVSW